MDRPFNVFGEDPAPNGSGGSPFRFPELPIINPAVPAPPPAPPRSQREKYGALFYLGIAGLLFVILLVGWFGYGVWSNRDIWMDVYAVHDASRPEADRIQAAFRLANNPGFADVQKLDVSLRKDPPELARYLLAESVSTEAVARDPRGYTMLVARSEGWPDWLRLVLSRRLAYGAGRGYDVPPDPLDELKRRPDPMIGLWATYALAVLPRSGPDPTMTAELEKAAKAPDASGELAALLLAALRAPEGEREDRLDDASTWLRRHHPEAAKIWQGCTIRDHRLVREGGG
jgi:hypothetical protein